GVRLPMMDQMGTPTQDGMKGYAYLMFVCGSDNEDANEHIEKVFEIVDLFHIPNITQDQVMLRAFPILLTGAASRWLRNEPAGSVTTWETLKEFSLRLGELDPTKLIIELADRTVKRPTRIAKNVLVGIDKFVFLVDFIILDMPEELKTPLIQGKPFLSTAHAKIDAFKRKITLRVGNDKVVFISKKPTKNITKRVYVLSLREKMELDLEARLIGEALILNRSLDLLYETILN
nr:hypothetical protein [Tanacetum cinerariifolium]